MIYTVLKIEEDLDYGCEERSEDSAGNGACYPSVARRGGEYLQNAGSAAL